MTPAPPHQDPIAKECIGMFDECASDEGCDCVAYCIMAANNFRSRPHTTIPSERDNILTLTFNDAETPKYIRLACRRKGTTIPDYLVDNIIEWDDKLQCMLDGVPKKINSDVCKDCEYINLCPDAVKPITEAHR